MDIRVNPSAPLPSLPAALAIARSFSKGVSQLKATVPGADVTVSLVTGSAEVVSAAGALTAAAPGRSGFDIAKDFIQANAALYGLTNDDIANLHFIGESVSQASGLRMVRVEQMVNGRPVFQSETRFIIDREGRLIRSVGLLVPDASAAAAAPVNTVSAQNALVTAMASVTLVVDPAGMTLTNTKPDGSKTDVVANHPRISGNVPSELVYFPIAPGVLVPAWSQVTMTDGEGDWYTLVDANTGALLWRKNIRSYASVQEARFSVYVQADGKTPADSPAPLSPTTATPGSGLQPAGIARTTVNMSAVQNVTASPNGWITDGIFTTTGNNVDAYLDRVITPTATENNVPDIGALDNNGRPIGNPDTASRNRDFLGTTPRDFTLTPPPQAGNPESGQTATGSPTTALNAFRRGVVTHLFYLSNWYHDQLYALGFDEAAGNFQTVNFSGMGMGNDRVLAEAQDGGSVNNANFSTPPDGQSGRMQMYIFTGPTVDRDGSLDAEIVLHELTHGLSNRLIGNGSGLNWDVGGGLGEGWSDYYALSLLNNSNTDDPNAKYASGAYVTYKLSGLTDNYLYGIRRFPYCTDNAVNPLTWADVDDVTYDLAGGIATSPLNFSAAGAGEVHNSGEIWAMTLWEVRSRVIADPAGANGNVPTGNNKMLQIVTDGMKMTPINPSFIDARDALIAADAAANAGANEQWIWQGFADRGLGYNAVAPFSRMYGYQAGHVSIGESFDVPYLDVQSVAIDDSLGNNNGAIDPGEPVKITVKLKNPWRKASFGVASATATLTTSTAGINITTGSATYPAIAAFSSADGTKFQFNVPLSATAGQAIKFTITPTSTLGTKAVDFTLRVGATSGNGTPITYTKTITGGLAIPDSSPRGVVSTLTITDDYEIADLNFRLDSLTHTWSGDVTALLRAPNGLGTDLISAVGGLAADGGSGDNFVNTVIDDQASGDLLTASAASAPFTGSWKPMFNNTSWDGAGLPHDLVGSLSRYNGLSTKGDWKVLVSDQATGDTGTLNVWSLIVTPKAYTVTSLVAPVLANIESGALSYTKNQAATLITTTLTVTDADSASLASGSVSITSSFASGQDVLSMNASPPAGITTNYNTSTGVLTLNGSSSVANYQAALRSVTYQNTSQTPSTATRTVTFKVNDGTADSNTQTRNIAVSVPDTTWAPSGSYAWSMANATGTPGAGWDWLNITGNLTITATNKPNDSQKYTIAISGAGLNFNNAVSNSWIIATVSGSVIEFNADKFLLTTNGFTPTGGLGGGSFSIVLSNRDVVLVFTSASPACSDTLSPTFAVLVPTLGTTNMQMTFINASKLSSVQALTMDNCAITGIAYNSSDVALSPNPIGNLSLTARTTLPANTVKVVLTATKLTNGVPAAVNVLAIDTCGRGKSFDPVITTLAVTSGNRVQQRFAGILSAERYLQVINGTPGLQWLEVNLNSHVFRLDPLAAGQSVAADLAPAMNEGDANVVVLTGYGDIGASALVLITDQPAGDLVQLSEVAELALALAGRQVIISWPEALAGWQLQASETLETGWQDVAATPMTADGYQTVSLAQSNQPQFFRLRKAPAATASAPAAATSAKATGETLSTTETPQPTKRTYDRLSW